MKKWIAALLLITCGTVTVRAEDYGHIQVKCPSDVQILLDGEFKGTASADLGGIIIQKVPPGVHLLRAIKTGFQPQDGQVIVRAGEVITYTLKPLVPKIEIEQKGDEDSNRMTLKVGNLLVQSLPVECLIKIPSLGLDGEAKTQDRWLAKDLPVGQHPATFTAMGKTLSTTVAIEQHTVTKLFLNFIESKIEVNTELTEQGISVKKDEKIRLRTEPLVAQAREALQAGKGAKAHALIREAGAAGASEAVLAPLNAELQKLTCTECGGRGKITYTAKETKSVGVEGKCGYCDNGRTFYYTDCPGKGGPGYGPCNQCDGRGNKTYYQTQTVDVQREKECEACKGTGYK